MITNCLLQILSLPINKGLIATGNIKILIRCAEHHPLQARGGMARALEVGANMPNIFMKRIICSLR